MRGRVSSSSPLHSHRGPAGTPTPGQLSGNHRKICWAGEGEIEIERERENWREREGEIEYSTGLLIIKAAYTTLASGGRLINLPISIRDMC